MDFKVLRPMARRVMMQSQLLTMFIVLLPVRAVWRAMSRLDRHGVRAVAREGGQIAHGGMPPLLSPVRCDAADHVREDMDAADLRYEEHVRPATADLVAGPPSGPGGVDRRQRLRARAPVTHRWRNPDRCGDCVPHRAGVAGHAELRPIGPNGLGVATPAHRRTAQLDEPANVFGASTHSGLIRDACPPTYSPVV
jgi:hypothetical protein